MKTGTLVRLANAAAMFDEYGFASVAGTMRAGDHVIGLNEVTVYMNNREVAVVLAEEPHKGNVEVLLLCQGGVGWFRRKMVTRHLSS